MEIDRIDPASLNAHEYQRFFAPGAADQAGNEPRARAWLAWVGFEDFSPSFRRLRRLAAYPDPDGDFYKFIPHLLHALAESSGADRVLVGFDRFISHFSEPAGLYRSLASQPRTVEILSVIFGGSQFLTEILLRHPEFYERLAAHRRLAYNRSADQYFTNARELLAECTSITEKLDALRQMQSWEQLRIGACDLLNLLDMSGVTRQLSNLADGMLRASLRIAAEQAGVHRDLLTVIGMGKLGGRELNYSSDIDLLFLSPEPTRATRLGEYLIDALARVTSDGFLYRVDMRLRPWGSVGPLVSSPQAYYNYLEKNARLWEKQALLKARPIAGDRTIGHELLDRAWPFLFSHNREQLRAEVFAMKSRTESHLRLNGRDWGEVKLGEGSIRDVEFTVQYLQLAYGAELPEIISPHSLDGLSRLAAYQLISPDEYRVLADGYIFLRTVEHYLQMMHYRQTHTLPQEPAAIAQLARRLGFVGSQPGEQFLERYQQHRVAIRIIYMRHVGSMDMTGTSSRPISQSGGAQASPDPQQELHRHLDRMAPTYSETFQSEEIARHAAMAGQLSKDQLLQVDAIPLENGLWRITIVAYDFPGELSVICGLMFVYGLNIINGAAFTYEPLAESSPRSIRAAAAAGVARKIVDVFTVQPVQTGGATEDTWLQYTGDLGLLLGRLWAGERREAQGVLAKRVAAHLQSLEAPVETREGSLSSGTAPNGSAPMLYPIALEIDNEVSDQYTALRITSQDTVGFLYELTNALALNGVYIAHMVIETAGSRVEDTLYVTDENSRKITDPKKQHELRTATVMIKHFTHLLRFSPNPESAMLHFRDFIAQLFQRPNWPDEVLSIGREEVLQGLARLLGVSDFLWDDFLRMQYVNLFPVVRDVDALESAKSRGRLQAELEVVLKSVHNGPQAGEEAAWSGALNAFKDREMFRIDMRHILGHTQEFWDFAGELSDLAEVVVNAAYHLCHEDLRSTYGAPYMDDGTPSQMAILALGKFGGRELGFASDIELIFVYSGNGRTSGPQVISTAEFYEKLVELFTRAIQARREGVFEIDLRLRPYGKAGSLAVSLDSFRRYFGPNGSAWAYERQALVRLRPVAGDTALGRQVAALRDEFVYTSEGFDVSAMRAMRERQDRHLVSGGTYNLKYSLGGLIDIEYLVQGLQILHGADTPAVRSTNSREAMSALAAEGILSAEDHARLRKAHTFLRWLIDALRVVRGNARDVTIPAEGSEEYAFLVRRMNYTADPGKLRQELARYTEDVRELNQRLLR